MNKKNSGGIVILFAKVAALNRHLRSGAPLLFNGFDKKTNQ